MCMFPWNRPIIHRWEVLRQIIGGILINKYYCRDLSINTIFTPLFFSLDGPFNSCKNSNIVIRSDNRTSFWPYKYFCKVGSTWVAIDYRATRRQFAAAWCVLLRMRSVIMAPAACITPHFLCAVNSTDGSQPCGKLPPWNVQMGHKLIYNS